MEKKREKKKENIITETTLIRSDRKLWMAFNSQEKIPTIYTACRKK